MNLKYAHIPNGRFAQIVWVWKVLGLGLASGKGAKEENCHFEPFDKAQDKLREKFFLDPAHSLGTTGLWPVTWRLCVVRLAHHVLRPVEGREILRRRFFYPVASLPP